MFVIATGYFGVLGIIKHRAGGGYGRLDVLIASCVNVFVYPFFGFISCESPVFFVGLVSSQNVTVPIRNSLVVGTGWKLGVKAGVALDRNLSGVPNFDVINICLCFQSVNPLYQPVLMRRKCTYRKK